MTERQLINVRVTKKEAAILAAYAKDVEETKTSVIRALIRSLALKKKPGK